MDTLADTTERPSLTPADIQLLSVLSASSIDERVAAQKTSMTVGELRTKIATLSRKLDLPNSDDVGHAFTQMARHAARVLKERGTKPEVTEKKSAADPLANLSPEWQAKLIEVAKAVKKGILVSVDPYLIRPLPEQPRDYFPTEEQGSLEDSLGTVGQVQDIIIRKKPPPQSRIVKAPDFQSAERRWRIMDTIYEICDGERRWRGVMKKGIIEVRAKLIEIDDEGAYLVGVVSNLNRVGHTTLERAQSIKRLLNGKPPFPLAVIATMQGISEATARKLLDTLELPPDIHQMMNPVAQRERGEMVLGKVPSYEVARLAKRPELHDTARSLAKQYVGGQIKLTELRAEVDRVISRSASVRDVLGERRQPARRIAAARDRLIAGLEKVQEAMGLLRDLKAEKILSPNDTVFGHRFNTLIDLSEEGLKLVGEERQSSKK